jgi:hypothetical protein
MFEIMNCKLVIDHEDFPNTNKTKHPKKGGEKGTRWKDPNLGKKKGTTNNYKRNINKSSTQTHPPFTRSIIDKERGGTLERTFSLEEPSFTTTCLKIEGSLSRCNTTNTLYTSHT